MRVRVGVHFTRHRGGPGWVTVEPGRLELAGGGQVVVQTGGSVRWHRKRFEPPWGNHWVEVTDGALTGHAVVSRRRCERLLAAARDAGFPVEGEVRR